MEGVSTVRLGGGTEAASRWAEGDGGRILKFQQLSADTFVGGLSLHAGDRVLDVACGVGNATVAAARAGVAATGLDIAEPAIEQARARARMEGLAIRFDVGDFEAMPCDNESFDVVFSMFGVMFAPHPERVVPELARVCRPGGLIALANWPADSLIGRLFLIATRYVPRPPGSPPLLWGQEETVRRWLSPFLADLEIGRRPYALRFPFPPARAAEAIRESIGPIRQGLAALDATQRSALQADIEGLFVAENRADNGSTYIPSEYLDVRGLRR